MYILKEAENKSEKLTVKINSPKEYSFIERLISEYKLKQDQYKLDKKEFVLFNNYKYYTFSDIRNDLLKKKIEYKEV